MNSQSTSPCTWCGEPIEREAGWRVQAVPSEHRAAFCRLEHVVPWWIQGAHWEAGQPAPERSARDLDVCAHCGAALEEVHLVLVRHRGEHRIPDAFCSVDHMAEWAKAGGRWA